jgi:hypothetical protein
MSALDPTVRRSIEDAIEHMIGLLDAIDGDPDLEDDTEVDLSEFEDSSIAMTGGQA